MFFQNFGLPALFSIDIRLQPHNNNLLVKIFYKREKFIEKKRSLSN